MTQGKSGPPAERYEVDFEEIEAAVMETARGRWFLAEFARRNRSADTEILLDALRKLENLVHERQPPDGLSHLRRDLMEMAAAIAQTRRDLAAMPAAMAGTAAKPSPGQELDSIVEATEKATSDILTAAEQIQEIAWTLREKGTEAEPCDALNDRATDIYTACSFQDLTGQRIGKVVAALNATEERLNALVDAWGLDDIEIKPRGGSDDGGDGAAAPEAKPTASQHEIDQLLVGAPAEPVETVAEAEPEAADAPPVELKATSEPAPPKSERQDPSLDLDRLTPAQKTALFS